MQDFDYSVEEFFEAAELREPQEVYNLLRSEFEKRKAEPALDLLQLLAQCRAEFPKEVAKQGQALAGDTGRFCNS